MLGKSDRLLAWFFFAGLEKTLDIALYDESSYLSSGFQLGTSGFPAAAYAPLYSLWYYVLSLFVADPIDLFFINHKLLGILPPVLVYIVLRRKKISSPASLIASLILLISYANTNGGLQVTHFALIVILGVFILSSYVDSGVWIYSISAVGALIAAFIRPEFFLAYIVFLFFLATEFFFDRRNTNYEKLIAPGLVAACSFLFLYILGFPLSGSRSFIAFGQHFSLNWISWNTCALDPWRDWEKIVFQNFGNVTTIPEALLANPMLLLKHIASNILNFLSHAPTYISPGVFFGYPLFRRLALALPFIAFGFFYFFNPALIKNNMRDFKIFMLLSIIFFLPGLSSAIVIYPEVHYFVIPVTIVFLISIVLITKKSSSKKRFDFVSLILIATLISLAFYTIPLKAGGRTNLATIEFIRSLNIKKSVHLLENDFGFSVYLGNNYKRVSESQIKDFSYLLNQEGVNMIILSEDLLKNAALKNNPELMSFLQSSAELGFLQIEIPDTHRKLILKKNLL